MTQRIFLTKSGTANSACPECGELQTLDVSKYQNIEKEVRLKCTCKCKHVFPVILERREHVRKEVLFPGVIFLKRKQRPVTIVNISRFGLQIRISRALNITSGDRVNIEFTLDDATRSRVRKKMIVRNIVENKIGMEFVDRNHYDKLGSYLLFHFS